MFGGSKVRDAKLAIAAVKRSMSVERSHDREIDPLRADGSLADVAPHAAAAAPSSGFHEGLVVSRGHSALGAKAGDEFLHTHGSHATPRLAAVAEELRAQVRQARAAGPLRSPV